MRYVIVQYSAVQHSTAQYTSTAFSTSIHTSLFTLITASVFLPSFPFFSILFSLFSFLSSILPSHLSFILFTLLISFDHTFPSCLFPFSSSHSSSFAPSHTFLHRFYSVLISIFFVHTYSHQFSNLNTTTQQLVFLQTFIFYRSHSNIAFILLTACIVSSSNTFLN